MKWTKSLYLIVLLGFLACNSSKNDPNQVKTIPLDNIPIQEDKLLIGQAILLGSDTLELLGSELRTVFSKHGFFVSNYNGPKAIHHFSPQGEHLGKITEVGEAPGQVLRFEEFRIHGDTLILNTGKGDHIDLNFFYIPDHRLVKTIETEASAFSFYPNEDGSFWLYSGLNKAVGDYRLQRVDQMGKVIEKRLFNDFNDALIPFTENSFFEGGERLLFREPLFPEIYEVQSDSLKLAYKMDFGSYSIPNEIWEIEDPFQLFEQLNKNGFADSYSIFENEKFFLADIVLQREGDYRKELLIIDRVSGESRKIEITQDNFPEYYSPFALVGSHVLFIAYAPALIQRIDELNVTEEVREQLKVLVEDSNPVILYGRLEK
ncbi:6-bladed beta-propeller [Algoriphagus formosus]|uniref:6-bladed beta-propeller n=1 Tax=Algoriphagus formosus TaxID=2007308 RepID=A0A4V3ASG5_9BACT|nr:6-bladed beta-propeller [Algoriphagus aquimaris]TDK50391.1 6-bladed beta-propeller [Algoriphagus aquimaris]